MNYRGLWLAAFCTGLLPPAVLADMFPFVPTTDLTVRDDGGNTKVDDIFLELGHGSGGAGPDDRALFKFDLSGLGGATVNSGTLSFHQVERGTSDQFGRAQVRRIGTSDWNAGDPGSTLYSLARDGSTAVLGGFSPAVNPPPGPKSLGITGAVAGWVDGSFPTYGLSLVQASEGFGNTQRAFLSSNEAKVALTVDFDAFPVGAQVAVLSPTVDLYVDESAGFAQVDNGELRFGHDGSGGAGNDDRALVRFDLSSVERRKIHAATIVLDQLDLPGTVDRFGSGQIRQITSSDWDGTETGATLYGLGDNANSSLIQAFSRNLGPPFGPDTDPALGLYHIDVTTLVASWADGSVPNFGLALRQGAEGFTSTSRLFASSDAGANGPQLFILYTPIPEPGGITLLIIAGIGLSRRHRTLTEDHMSR